MFPFCKYPYKVLRLLLISLLLNLAKPLYAQFSDPLPFDTTQYQLREVTYKSALEAALQLHLYYPVSKAARPLPAILFFFGGGWTSGNHQHFAPHSKYLASRGMIAVTADYRIKNKHGTSPVAAIQDAREALRYLAEHGTSLGIDTTQLAVGGGSAGGHLALSTVLIDHFDEDKRLGYTPKALILYNPVVNTTSAGFGAKRLGKDSLTASPVHHLTHDMPPLIVFHGEADTTVPIENIREMQAKTDSLGVPGKYLVYPGQKHGFFNMGRQVKHEYFLQTLYETDRFLVERKFLSGQPLYQNSD